MKKPLQNSYCSPQESFLKTQLIKSLKQTNMTQNYLINLTLMSSEIAYFTQTY